MRLIRLLKKTYYKLFNNIQINEMEDQYSQILQCQRIISELQQQNQRMDKRLEIQEQKLSSLTVNFAQRNEDLLSTIEKYTPLKVFREETQYFRNYFETKTKGFIESQDQLSNSMHKQLSLMKDDYNLQYQNTIEKVQRLTKDVLFQIEQIEKQIHVDTMHQIDLMTRKAGEMEQTIMGLFAQKHKLIEKLTLCQENQNAKINLFESLISQQGSTISKIHTSIKKTTPYQSAKKLNFDQTDNVPIEMLKRQEDVLLSVTQSIQNIEKKLAETEAKPKIKRDLSYDKYSLQWSNQKPDQYPSQYNSPNKEQEQKQQILFNHTFSRPVAQQERQGTDVSSNVAENLINEQKSPLHSTDREINKNPILQKVSPKPIISTPTQNMYDDVRIEKEYQQQMAQLKQQEDYLKKQKQQKLIENEKQISAMKKSLSQLSNDSSVMKNESYFLKNESQQMKNDSQFFKNESLHGRNNESQDFKKGSGGLKDLMRKSKDREKDQFQNTSNRDLMKRGQQNKDVSPSKLQPLMGNQSSVSQHGSSSGGKKSRTNQMKNLVQQQKVQNESAEEVIYQLDDEGYLMDEQGNYLLDERGNYIQLSDKDLEELKRQNMVIEQ
ncbi:hypothetical protein pb186bvf_004501 [Paramecium bursaria]